MAKRAPPSGGKFPPQKKGAPKKQTSSKQSAKVNQLQRPPAQQVVSQPPVASPMQSTAQMGAQLPPAPIKRGLY